MQLPSILVLFEYETLNGGERSFLATLEHLRRTGLRLIAAAPQRGPLFEQLSRLNVETVAWDVHDPGMPVRDQSQLREDLRRLILRVRPDLIHSNSLAMSRLLGPVAADCQIPSIGHVRDIVGLSRKAIDDVNQNNRLLFVSWATCRFHVARGIDGTKSFVVHNGIALSRPESISADLKEALNIPTDGRLIGFIGQIGLRKGIDHLLSACELAFTQLNDVHLLIVGERFSQKEEAVDHEQELRRRCNREPLAGHVHWLGWRNDVPELLSSLDMLVHPARQEPFGRVLLEAAALAVPVVATDVGGTREVFGRDGGQLVDPNSTTDLADAMSFVLSNRAETGLMVGRAANRMARLFSVDRVVGRMVRHYSQCITGSGAR